MYVHFGDSLHHVIDSRCQWKNVLQNHVWLHPLSTWKEYATKLNILLPRLANGIANSMWCYSFFVFGQTSNAFIVIWIKKWKNCGIIWLSHNEHPVSFNIVHNANSLQRTWRHKESFRIYKNSSKNLNLLQLL